MSFENREELADKVEWEGGLYDALSYGIRAVDLPEEDIELVEAWHELEDAFDNFVAKEYRMSVLLNLE